MVYVALIFLEIAILFFLSRRLTRALYKFFFLLTKKKETIVYLYALLFAPGTFIHELAHFLSALVLLVPVGQFEIFPKIEETQVKLGSTPIGKTDPFRRALVGIAPLIFGVGVIFAAIHFALLYNVIEKPLITLLITYLTFEVANTMFLSKKDLEGMWMVVIIIVMLYLFYNILGIEIHFGPDVIYSPSFTDLLIETMLYLLIPIFIDFVLLSSFYAFGVTRKN